MEPKQNQPQTDDVLDLHPKGYGNLWGGAPIQPSAPKPSPAYRDTHVLDLRPAAPTASSRPDSRQQHSVQPAEHPQDRHPAPPKASQASGRPVGLPAQSLHRLKQEKFISDDILPDPSLDQIDSYSLPPAPVRQSRLRSFLTYVALAVFGVALGLLASNLQSGQWIVLSYGLSALIFKIRSNYTFGAALFMLVLVPLFLLLENEVLAENFAVYAFLLLVAGVLAAMLELWRGRAGPV